MVIYHIYHLLNKNESKLTNQKDRLQLYALITHVCHGKRIHLAAITWWLFRKLLFVKHRITEKPSMQVVGQ